MLAKQDQGCRFFITQSVYDSASTKSLLSDYALSLQSHGRSPVPLVLTFSPCGSVREKRLPIGINVESVSIRKLEIDASVELVSTIEFAARRVEAADRAKAPRVTWALRAGRLGPTFNAVRNGANPSGSADLHPWALRAEDLALLEEG